MKRLTNNVITGSGKRLGLYFYYSHHFGLNIVRKTTSLTGQRVKTENAFSGFRESSNRMKQASPIAASLYKLIPAETKQYSIYRLLMSETLKMIKEGLDSGFIIESLHRTYIEPLITEPEKELNRIDKIEPVKGHDEKGLRSFIRFPEQKPHNPGRIRKSRRHLVLQHVVQNTEFQTGTEFLNEQNRNTSVRHKIVSLAQKKFKHASKRTEEKISGLVYLCRLPECKSLKIWIRPSDFPAISG